MNPEDEKHLREAANRPMNVPPFFHALFKQMSNAFIEEVSKDKTWYTYQKLPGQIELCVVCKLPLWTGDKCRVVNCAHHCHVECAVRYYERVEPCCPMCKTPMFVYIPPKPEKMFKEESDTSERREFRVRSDEVPDK